MMRSITRWVLLGVIALTAGTALDVGASTAEASVSPFAGTWSGTWTGDNGFDGILSWTVSDAGQLTGGITHAQLGDSGAIHGHISANGLVRMVAFAPSDDPSVSGCGVPLHGSGEIDGAGKLFASLRGTATGASFVVILEKR